MPVPATLTGLPGDNPVRESSGNDNGRTLLYALPFPGGMPEAGFPIR